VRVQRIDECLGTLTLPSLERADSFRTRLGDCLIVCAGFEDRSLAVLRSLPQTSEGLSIILIEYRPIVAGNHLDECLAECVRLKVKPERFVYDRENPAGAGEQIWAFTNNIEGRTYVDVSGMSRLLIVQLLSILPSVRQTFRNVTILYTEAERYHPNKEEFDRRSTGPPLTVPLQFLSWGVSQITVVPELSSVALEDQPRHLIVFPTFDPQQLSSVRKDVEPSVLTIVHGRPLPRHGEWRKDAIDHLNALQLVREKNEYVTSTYDYRETIALLLEIYSGAARFQRIVICPTGSKMQTTAVGLIRAFLQDLTIVYPTPSTFKTDAYTTGSKHVYRLDLDTFSDMIE
jgi:hypothetical protein